jgi:hypothetical protein
MYGDRDSVRRSLFRHHPPPFPTLGIDVNRCGYDGVAFASLRELTEHAVTTALAQNVGTPLDMSPEQAGLSSL